MVFYIIRAPFNGVLKTTYAKFVREPSPTPRYPRDPLVQKGAAKLLRGAARGDERAELLAAGCVPEGIFRHLYPKLSNDFRFS